MEISVASGTYNRLPYLKRMVVSVRQSLAGVHGLDYEIVLVDGGSKDGTLEWCEKQPDIRLIKHGKLLGAVRAFNDGAYAAQGRYVIMANDDIEFVGDSILCAYAYMETHPTCGGGCFYQDRDGRDWHVDGMQAVQIVQKGKIRHAKRIHVYYAQVGIFPKWLGDQVGWWCDEDEYGIYLKGKNRGDRIGLHTYGGDNELSARIIDLGFTVDPIVPGKPLAKITDKEAKDDLRRINNIDGANDPKAVRGEHPDSFKFGQKWIERNNRLGVRGHYPGPILKEGGPMIPNPNPVEPKERVLYLPLFEQGWQVQKEQKRGLRDALAAVTYVYEYDYMTRYHQIGDKEMMTELEGLFERFRPTLFLSQLHNSDQVKPEDIKTLRGIAASLGVQTRFVNWNGDYWPDQCINEEGIALARSFDLMTHVNGYVIEKYKELGINSAYWQIGWEPDGRGYEPETSYDVVFLASGYSQKRQALGKMLAAQPYSLGLYGNGWGEGMSRGECLYNFIEACKIYRGARLAIGDAQWGEEAEGYVSNRLFQILAAGNCVLCHQWFRNYERLGLIDNVNCVIWQDMGDLQNKLKYWLAPANQGRLTEIAAAGERLALDYHSFESRVTELWQMLGISSITQEEFWRW